MRLFELTLPRHKTQAPTPLSRLGWQKATSGYFSDIYTKPGVDYVLKLFDHDDTGYREFLQLVWTHPNPHWPVIKGKLMKVSQCTYAVRLEKLAPAPSAPYLGVYLACGDKEPIENNVPRRDSWHRTMEYLADHPSLKEALDLIREHIVPHYHEDLHDENVMQRADGTLVIIDPVSFAKRARLAR